MLVCLLRLADNQAWYTVQKGAFAILSGQTIHHRPLSLLCAVFLFCSRTVQKEAGNQKFKASLQGKKFQENLTILLFSQNLSRKRIE